MKVIADDMSVLELVVKVATVIGFLIAYRQFKRNGEIAKKSVQREAVRLAAEQARQFGCVIINDVSNLRRHIEESGSAFFRKCKMTIEEENIHVDWSAASAEDLSKLAECEPEITRVLNSIEAFAIYFATDVADDKIGYVECGPGFVSLFEEYFALFGRSNLQMYYRASQHLYFRWKKRMRQPNLTQQAENLKTQAILFLKSLLSNELKPRDPLGS